MSRFDIANIEIQGTDVRTRGRSAALSVAVLAMLMALSGCSGSPESPTGGASPASPAVPRAIFPGSLVTFIGSGYAVLRMGADGKLAVAKKVDLNTDNPNRVVSTDRRTIAYPRGDSLYLRPLPDGAEQTVPGTWTKDVSCLTWSPDGRRLMYRRADDLVVADMSGTVSVIEKVRHETYHYQNSPQTMEVASGLACGTWLGDHRLLYYRTKRMPATVEYNPLSPALQAPTDTIALVNLDGPTPKVTDTAISSTSLFACGKRILSQTDGGVLYLIDGASDADIVKATRFAAAGARVGLGSVQARDVEFTPGTCQPWLLGKDSTYRAIDPATRKVASTPAVTVPEYFDVAAYGQTTGWQPTGGAVLAGTTGVASDAKVYRVDLTAGKLDTIPVADHDLHDDLIGPVLAWLP
jgi:WD40 repeat protein